MTRLRLLGAVLVVLAASCWTAACTPEEEQVERAPVFLTGTVTDDGKPVVDAEVSVQLRDERVEATAEVGDTIPVLTVGETTTDESREVHGAGGRG